MTEKELQTRIAAERAKTKRLIKALLKAGHRLSVIGRFELDYEIENSVDADALLQHATSMDDAVIQTHNGFVLLVFGETAEDLICDYSMDLEKIVNEVEAVKVYNGVDALNRLYKS